MNKHDILRYILKVYEEIIKDAEQLRSLGYYEKSSEKLKQCDILNKLYDYIYNSD